MRFFLSLTYTSQPFPGPLFRAHYHPATEFVDHPKHQLVPVVLNHIEEHLQLIYREVPNGLAETLIFWR